MAKKIRLDFSKTEERSGWNTKHINEGLHKMNIVAVQETEAQDGTAMLIYALVPTESRLKTRRFPYYCKLQANQLWKLRDLLVAAGQSVPKKAVQIDPASVVGKMIAAEVEDDTYQGVVRSQVQGTYGLDILDEDASDTVADTEDEDEEEFEEAEDEAEEDDYEEDEDDEDDEIALSDMSIAELRAHAKALGLTTTKKTKAVLIDEIEDAEDDGGDDEDDEDLDDEDLDDEELFEDDEEDDEEEEEEAPAPKRRPAPARKAAPKRTIKRR